MIFIIIGLSLSFYSYQQQIKYEKQRAEKVALLFLNEIAQEKLASAFEHIWQDAQVQFQSHQAVNALRDIQVIDVFAVEYDTADNRPDYYKKFNKIISIGLKIKTKYVDMSGLPPGEYILFITLIQEQKKSPWLVTEFGTAP